MLEANPWRTHQGGLRSAYVDYGHWTQYRYLSELIREAHGAGAQLISLPEVVNLVQRSRRKSAEVINTEDEETSLKAYRGSQLNSAFGCIQVPSSSSFDDERNVNRSFLIDDKGAIAATYDKIHMFDVDLENGVSFRESRAFRPGARAVVAERLGAGSV